MPDAYFHYSISNLSKCFRNINYLPEYLLGGILPDLLGRVPCYLTKRDLYWFVAPFHSPIVLVVVCYLISLLFFEEKMRRPVFLNMYAGVFLHVVCDLCQLQFGPRVYYYPFFPFSFRTVQIPVFHHIDQSMYLFPLLVILNIILWRKRRHTRKGGVK